MVAAAERAARARARNVEYRVLDAQAIDLPDASVDGVLCRWGYMLVPDPLRALRETRRVLRPGGRVAFAVWAAATTTPGHSLSAAALLERGLIEPPTPGRARPFRLGEPERVARSSAERASRTPLEDVPLTAFTSRPTIWADYRRIVTSLAAVSATTLETWT